MQIDVKSTLKRFEMPETIRETFSDINIIRASNQRNCNVKKRENIVYNEIIFKIIKFTTSDN